MDKLYDVIIIGSGVVGNAIAREMSRYNLKIGVLEKELDVCNETSARNSGVLHAGFNNKPVNGDIVFKAVDLTVDVIVDVPFVAVTTTA